MTPQFGNKVSIFHDNSGPCLTVSLLHRVTAVTVRWNHIVTDLCPCGEKEMMCHIVDTCPLSKLIGGLSQLRSADDEAVAWLISYGS